MALLVGNGARYTEKTTDPWYRGTVSSENWRSQSSLDSAAQVAYSPEEAASPLGCRQQYQICNVDASHCGPLKGFFDFLFQSASVFNVSEETMNKHESVGNNPLGQRFQWFTDIVANRGSIDISKALSQLGVYSLSSQSSMGEGFMAPLAENQWHLDVERWWATGLCVYARRNG